MSMKLASDIRLLSIPDTEIGESKGKDVKTMFSRDHCHPGRSWLYYFLSLPIEVPWGPSLTLDVQNNTQESIPGLLHAN